MIRLSLTPLHPNLGNAGLRGTETVKLQFKIVLVGLRSRREKKSSSFVRLKVHALH